MWVWSLVIGHWSSVIGISSCFSRTHSSWRNRLFLMENFIFLDSVRVCELRTCNFTLTYSPRTRAHVIGPNPPDSRQQNQNCQDIYFEILVLIIGCGGVSRTRRGLGDSLLLITNLSTPGSWMRMLTFRWTPSCTKIRTP